MLIPGAFELNAAPHRATGAADMMPAAPPEPMRRFPADEPHVVAAPARPTTRLGHAAAILSDLALILAIIYGVTVVPALAMWGFKAAASLIETFGR